MSARPFDKLRAGRHARLRWFGTGCGLAGALTLAANLPVSGWGFAVFLGNSVPWAWVGWRTGDRALLAVNLGFTAANLVGIWRWLI